MSTSVQKSAKIIFILTNRHKNWICQKFQKTKFHLAFYQKWKKVKGVKKGQKLQIWLQKSQSGNTGSHLCCSDHGAGVDSGQSLRFLPEQEWNFLQESD